MPFEVLVTKDELDISDARQLAVDIQTAKEHTLRELGKRLKVMSDNGMSQTEIAKAEGISPAKITRAFQAAAVPDEMIAVFPSLSDLAIPDYQLLLEIAEQAKSRQVDVLEVVEGVRVRIQKDGTYDAQDPLNKTKIIGFFKAESNGLKSPRNTKKAVVEKLAEFSDKKQFARKKTDAEKRLITYEFSRIPSKYHAELDAAIKSVMDKLQAEE